MKILEHAEDLPLVGHFSQDNQSTVNTSKHIVNDEHNIYIIQLPIEFVLNFYSHLGHVYRDGYLEDTNSVLQRKKVTHSWFFSAKY